MNTVVNAWAGAAREEHTGPIPQYFYPESGVMVVRSNNRLIYGDICKWMTEEINQEKMIKYLWGKNPHWYDKIFDAIDWRAI